MPTVLYVGMYAYYCSTGSATLQHATIDTLTLELITSAVQNSEQCTCVHTYVPEGEGKGDADFSTPVVVVGPEDIGCEETLVTEVVPLRPGSTQTHI